VRRGTARALLLPLLAAAVLGGCSSGDNASKAATEAGLPTVAGAYGSKPTFTFPGKTPPKALESTVLRKGTGKAVAKGDLLVADYLGQVWQGAVFDNSYDRKAPAGFVIGAGKVITGWDDVLVGVPAGSRVLMTIPPAKGYGPTGNDQAGIKGTDTLVFVVDVVASYGKTSVGDTKALAQKATIPGVTVKGALGETPTLAVAKGAKAPTKPVITVLAKGTGKPVAAGLLVVQYVATRYNGEPAGSTFTDGVPAAVTVAGGSNGTPFDLARGVPLGSRVLLQLPGSQGQPAVAVVVDLVDQPKTAAETD
jgi:peptidylprolyl isomerase